MEKDKKTSDLKLEAFLARESARRRRAAVLNESPKDADEDLDRLVEEELIRRTTEEDEEQKKR